MLSTSSVLPEFTYMHPVVLVTCLPAHEACEYDGNCSFSICLLCVVDVGDSLAGIVDV